MSGEESDDELPSITVISLSQDSSARQLVMPPAGALAAERARELHTERELQLLRELHAAGPPRSDSSGSEGEAALARAVRALRVLPPDAPRAPHANTARALLALLPERAQRVAGGLAGALQDRADSAALARLTDKVILALSGVARCESDSWSDEEAVSTLGLACVVCLARRGLRARRCLHAVCARAGPRAVRAVVALCGRAARPPGSPNGCVRALQWLGDAARGGPGPATLLADLLVRHALHALLREPAPPESDMQEPLTVSELSGLLLGEDGTGWRGLEAGARLPALRLAARVLAAQQGPGPHATQGPGPDAQQGPHAMQGPGPDAQQGPHAMQGPGPDAQQGPHAMQGPGPDAQQGPGPDAQQGPHATQEAARARLLTALTQAAPALERHHPDYLKVKVTASTLQLLFSTQP